MIAMEALCTCMPIASREYATAELKISYAKARMRLYELSLPAFVSFVTLSLAGHALVACRACAESRASSAQLRRFRLLSWPHDGCHAALAALNVSAATS